MFAFEQFCLLWKVVHTLLFADSVRSGNTCGRFSFNQSRTQLCAADWDMVNERIQYNICTAAKIITLLSDSGKRRGEGCSKFDIVKADHTYIIWHIEAVQLAFRYNTLCDSIAATEDSSSARCNKIGNVVLCSLRNIVAVTMSSG